MSETGKSEMPPAAKIEEEPLYAMNIFTNRDAVIAALTEMEGQDWYEKHQPTWREYSIDGAIADAIAAAEQGIRKSGMIYGLGGLHRYIVRANGDVYYSGRHGQSRVDQAQKLGFKIN